jgi:hypothetical protein
MFEISNVSLNGGVLNFLRTKSNNEIYTSFITLTIPYWLQERMKDSVPEK